MAEIPSTLAAQISQDRLNVGLSAIKQNAEAERQIADLLQSSISSVPGSPVRGVNVNIKA
jgi:hypothetical protein